MTPSLDHPDLDETAGCGCGPSPPSSGAVGLTTQLHNTQGVLDITATMHQPGSKEIDVVVDEDSYVEIRYWSDPAATPAQLVGIISRALITITKPA